MKLVNILALFCLLCSVACDNLQTKNSSRASSNPKKEVETICLWEELSVREKPSVKSKYITSIFLGEKVVSWGESQEDTLSERKRIYTKVRLTDGTIGWSQDDFLAVDAKPGVILQSAGIYKRPDLLTSTQQNFARMDFIAIREVQGDWYKVKGKRKEDSWFTTGWVKASNISTNLTDISFAVLVNRALSENDEELREEKVGKILSNNDLKPAVFYKDFTGEEYVPEESAETQIEQTQTL